MVRASGFGRVLLAGSSDEAFALLVDDKPGLVLIDFATGPQDACTFARRVRRGSGAHNRAVPIIVLMARATRADVQAAREAGIDAVLMKPCSQAMVQEKVAAVMSEGRPFVVSAAYVGPCRRRKADAEYRGPLRRMSDPSETAHQWTDTLYVPPKELLDALARLAATAMTMDTIDGGAQQILSRTLQVRAIALDSGDSDAAEGAHELLRYLEAVGATARLSPQAVQVHIEALNQIVALPPSDRAMRMRLSDGLKRLVTKKISVALAS
jgi:DNA-binding response OmpR family regulator